MKRLVALVILAAGMAQSITAQVQRTVTPKAKTDTAAAAAPAVNDKMKGKKMLKELKLTKEQKGKLKEQRQEAKSKNEAIENNDKLSQQEKDSQLKELKKEQVEKTGAILNDEQKEKLKKMRRHNKKEKPGKGVTSQPNDKDAAGKAPEQQ
jgi:hypothetical protein